jgi:hypothetical protein
VHLKQPASLRIKTPAWRRIALAAVRRRS